MKDKKAKFFCENCGSEVPENARMCKNCGKFFISVRCPACGATGKQEDFEAGCPVCGYAENKNGTKSTSNIEKSQNNKKTKIFSHHFRGASKSHTSISQDSSLPLWIYIITFAIFVVVIFFVIKCQ